MPVGAHRLPPCQQLLIGAWALALGGFRRDIAPTARMRAVELLGPGERIDASALTGRQNGALAFAKEGRLQWACEVRAEVARTADDLPARGKTRKPLKLNDGSWPGLPVPW